MIGYIEIKHGAKLVNASHIAEIGEAGEMYDGHIHSYIVLSTGDVIACEETLTQLKNKIMKAREAGNTWG